MPGPQDPPFPGRQLVRDVWEDFVQRANQAPPPTQDQATDVLQVLAPSLTDTEGDAFFVAVAQIYNDLGITSQNTYIALRNEINTAGETASMLVYDTIVNTILSLPEVSPLFQTLGLKSMQDEVAQIPTDITTIETHRDAQTDQVLIDALNEGITRKNERKARLDSILG